MVIYSNLPVKGERIFHSPDPYWFTGSNDAYQKWNEPPWWKRFPSWISSANWTISAENVRMRKINSWLARLTIHRKWNLLRWCSVISGVMGLPGSPDVKPSKPCDETVRAKNCCLDASLTTWVQLPRDVIANTKFSSYFQTNNATCQRCDEATGVATGEAFQTMWWGCKTKKMLY